MSASMIVASNKPFGPWGEIFSDDMAATAMIDRLIRGSGRPDEEFEKAGSTSSASRGRALP
jgi:DNA replication protein DnaC